MALAAVAILIVGGCGGGAGGAATDPAATARAILGHAPTGTAAAVVQKKTLIVAVDGAFPPQSSLDPSSKQLVGFNIDVARRVGAILGLKVEFVIPAWDTVARTLADGTCDVAIDSLPITKSARNALSFGAPYAYQQAVVLVPSAASPPASVTQLQGSTVGAVAQSVFERWLQKIGGVSVVSYGDISGAIADLNAGKIGAVMTDQANAWSAIASGESLAIGGPFFYEPLGFATAMGQTDLSALFDHAIASMRGDGSLARISAKWYGGHDLSKAPAAGLALYAP